MTPDYTELLQQIREAAGDPRGKLMQDELVAHIAERTREGARYRWLRDKSEPGICAFYLSVGMGLHGVRFKPETVDEAIDAQIGSAPAGEVTSTHAPGPWKVVALLRKPEEPRAGYVIRRVVWTEQGPGSEYLRSEDGSQERKFGPDDYEAACDEAGRLNCPDEAPRALKRGAAVLRNVIECLRSEARFVDEEGDATDALEDLLRHVDGVIETVDGAQQARNGGGK